MVIEGLGLVKAQAVAEQELLGPGVHPVLFIVGNDLFPPFVGVAAVMADAGIVIDHGAVKVQQKKVRGHSIRQSRSVVPVVLVVPILHGIVVGIGQRDAVNTLVHLDKFVGIGTDGLQVVLFGKVDIGGAGAVAGFRSQALDHHVLPLPA